MTLRNIIVIAIILSSVAIAAAQQPVTKVGVIDSNAFFQEKTGITKLINANKQLVAEFSPIQTELETLNKRLQALATELENLRKQPNPDQRIFQAKRDEGEQLQRTTTYKAEDAKERYAKREREVVGPIQTAVGLGLQEFAKVKGYALIFDAARDQTGFLVAVGDQTVDVTKDFITFYNAKP